MLNRLIVAAVLLFAFAECQYSSLSPYGGGGYGSFGGGYGGGYSAPTFGGYGSYGAGFGAPTYGGYGASPYGGAFPGYGGYGYGYQQPSFTVDPITVGRAGGNDYTVTKPGGGLNTIAYGTSQFPAPYYPSAPYQGSPFGLPDYYPRNYVDLYGNYNPQGPPPPPRYSGGVPYGFYEPDTYSTGLPPPNFKPNPIAGGLKPINGYPGVLAPNPYFLGDTDDIPYKVFERLYKEQYGVRYDPSSLNVPSTAPAPAAAPFNYPAPGTNYFGYNVGLVPNYGSTGAIYPAFPTQSYGPFNGYGQPGLPPTTTAAPPTDSSSTSTSAPPSTGGGGSPAT